MIRTFLICWTLLAASLPGLALRTLTDETQRVVDNLPDHPHRIICLVPSITDSVFAIGAGQDVVAISDYTKYPAEALDRPSVGSIMNPSMETILSLHPDLVLGMPRANQQATLDQLKHLGIPVYLVDPHGIAGILHSISSLGQATNRPVEAAAEISRLEQRIDAVKNASAGKPIVSVFMPVSYDPPITIGKGAFITEIIQAAGGHSITDDIQQEWPHVSMEAVVARAPEALLLVRGGMISVDVLRTLPAWNILPAVRNARVYFVDKRIEFPSPIAINALEDLARQFHP